MFSIIIPTYCSALYIHKALDSILSQGICMSLVEVIIIDDNSKDFDLLSYEVSKYQQKLNIKLIRNDKKGNASVSRNIGIKNSSFDIICLLDADDYWSSNKLESGLKILNAEKSNVVYTKLKRGTYEQLDNNQYKLIPKYEKKTNESLAKYWFEKNGVTQTSSLMYNKKQFGEVLFNENLPRHQDYDFCLKLESFGAQFILDRNSITNWVILDNELNAVKKGASFEFCKSWLSDYSSYINERSQNYYIGKNLFLISLKSKEIGLWLRYVFSLEGKNRIPKIFFISLTTILTKIMSKVTK
ncbi:TPA: glycosyltransferase family 2 protein [Vibrio parahaemolyticus]